jgi:hypothetical protein
MMAINLEKQDTGMRAKHRDPEHQSLHCQQTDRRETVAPQRERKRTNPFSRKGEKMHMLH